MPPDAERGLAVYAGGRLAMALAPGGGAVSGPAPGSVLMHHPAWHGRVHEVARMAELMSALSAGDLGSALESAGFQVRPTPLSALEWAL